MDLSRYTQSLALVLAAACTPAQSDTIKERAALEALSTGGCIDPVSLGALPDDGVSDRVPIQAAIDAAVAQPDGGTVCLGPGRWTLDRAPPGSFNRFAALSTHGHNLTIRGSLPETVLELVGDQGASTTIVLSIDPGAEHIRVTDLTIDTGAAINTAEQTHAVATSGTCGGATCMPIRNVEIDHVAFRHPRNTPARKGDCIRLLGNTVGTEVWGVRVHDNTGDCARSFVEIQRGVHDLIVDRNTITCVTCDQDVDGEPSGVVGDIGRPTGIVISSNTFIDGPAVQGDFSIALTSITGATVTGNTMERGIVSYRSKDVAIVGNVISASRMTSGRGVIDVANACDGLVIASNVIRRGGVAGPVIALGPHSGTTCSGAMVQGNRITQGTLSFGVKMESASNTLVTNNQIAFTAPAPAYSAVYSRSVLAGEATTALLIAHNLITGSVTYGVTLETYPGTFGAGVSVAGNTATGTMFGLRINGSPGEFSAPVTSSANTMGPGAYGGVPMTTGE